MGRRLHSTLPMTTEQLTPTWPYLDDFCALNTEFKQQQKTDFDRRHCSLPLPPIPNDTEVWVTSGLNITSGRVMTPANCPQSYVVNTPNGEVRRNRINLNVVPDQQPSTLSHQNVSPQPHRPITRSVTGATVRPPEIYRH